MLSFAVFEGDGPALTWPVRLGYLYAAGDLPIATPLRFEDGILIGDKPTKDAAGLVVQFLVDPPPGAPATFKQALLTLRTTLLPERDRPYILSLELARSRVMEFLNSLEEWGLVELSTDDPVLVEFERARAMFTEALVADGRGIAHGESPSADVDRAAKKALALAISAGDQLAVRAADAGLQERLSGRLAKRAATRFAAMTMEQPKAGEPIVIPGSGRAVLTAPPQVGCSIAPESFGEPLQRAAMASCDFVSMPLRWIDIEPSEDKFDFATTDRWIEWAVRHAKLPVVAGPILDFRPTCVPDWLYIWENDYETLRDIVHKHVSDVVTRYRRTVTRWTVASGLHVNSNFKLTFEQILDLTRIGVATVRKLHPAAKLQIEIAQPWGDYHAEHRRSIPPEMYANALIQAGLPIDAIALRIQVGQPTQGRSARDLMAISTMLDRYGSLERPIVVSAAGAPAQAVPSSGTPAREGGCGFTPWSDLAQAEWLQSVALVCLAKPFVHSFCWQQLIDGGSRAEMPSGGLLMPSGAPRPALVRLAGIRNAIRDGKVFGA